MKVPISLTTSSYCRASLPWSTGPSLPGLPPANGFVGSVTEDPSICILSYNKFMCYKASCITTTVTELSVRTKNFYKNFELTIRAQTSRGTGRLQMTDKVRPKIVSLDKFRAGERRPSALSLDDAVPTSRYEDAATTLLNQLASTPGLRQLKIWTSDIPAFAKIASAHNTGSGPHEIDSRRYEAAQASLEEHLEEFEGFIGRFHILLVNHAAEMTGFPRRDQAMFAAEQAGKLAPENFLQEIAESPYQEALLSGLLVFQVGLTSPHVEVVRDSIVWASRTLENLSYMPGHPGIIAGKHAVVKAAENFPYRSESVNDCSVVAAALRGMTSALPVAVLAVELSALLLNGGVFR